jgi:hypothetical protein
MPVRSGYASSVRPETASGNARQATLRVYRGGEVRGQGLQMQTYDDRVLGDLVPCR